MQKTQDLQVLRFFTEGEVCLYGNTYGNQLHCKESKNVRRSSLFAETLP